MMNRAIPFVLALLVFVQPAHVAASSFPGKPVRLVLPLAPGGATDILARAVSRQAAQQFGQNIVIDNRPGAGGIVASELVSKSRADGYTLLFANFATHAVTPTLFPRLSITWCAPYVIPGASR